MARKNLLTDDERNLLFGFRLDRASMAQHYTILPEDRVLIEDKRGNANRLGFAVQLMLLRHPGFGYRHHECLPGELVQYIGEQ
jgi:hypothetical protein